MWDSPADRLINEATVAAQKLKTGIDRQQAYKRWFSKDGLIPFAFEAVKWVDERDEENSVKAPLDEPYIRYLLEHFRSTETLVVVKSRQVCVSWCAYTTAIWEILRRPNCHIAFVPGTEEDGKAHMEKRIFGAIWYNLDPWLKSLYQVSFVEGQFVIKSRRDEKWDSWIVSYARGEHQLRNFTHSIVLWDEMGKQDMAYKTWRAAVPTVGGRMQRKGRLWCLSTPIPGSKHHELCGPEIVPIAAQVARGEIAEVAA